MEVKNFTYPKITYCHLPSISNQYHNDSFGLRINTFLDLWDRKIIEKQSNCCYDSFLDQTHMYFPNGLFYNLMLVHSCRGKEQ
jgi:hypothetical protein